MRVSPFAFVIDPQRLVRQKGVVNSREQVEYFIKHAKEHRTLDVEKLSQLDSDGALP